MGIIGEAFKLALKRLQGKPSGLPSTKTQTPMPEVKEPSKVLVVGDKLKPITINYILKVVEDPKKMVPRYPGNNNISYYNPNPITDNRCVECDLDPVEKKDAPDVKKIMDTVLEEADIECDPKTCWGECNGKGNCGIAKEWQKRIHPSPIYTRPVSLTKKQKKKQKKKYKQHKEKWKNKRYM